MYRHPFVKFQNTLQSRKCSFSGGAQHPRRTLARQIRVVVNLSRNGFPPLIHRWSHKIKSSTSYCKSRIQIWPLYSKLWVLIGISLPKKSSPKAPQHFSGANHSEQLGRLLPKGFLALCSRGHPNRLQFPGAVEGQLYCTTSHGFLRIWNQKLQVKNWSLEKKGHKSWQHLRLAKWVYTKKTWCGSIFCR